MNLQYNTFKSNLSTIKKTDSIKFKIGIEVNISSLYAAFTVSGTNVKFATTSGESILSTSSTFSSVFSNITINGEQTIYVKLSNYRELVEIEVSNIGNLTKFTTRVTISGTIGATRIIGNLYDFAHVGTLEVLNYWGNYDDYTKNDVYIPFNCEDFVSFKASIYSMFGKGLLSNRGVITNATYFSCQNPTEIMIYFYKWLSPYIYGGYFHGVSFEFMDFSEFPVIQGAFILDLNVFGYEKLIDYLANHTDKIKIPSGHALTLNCRGISDYFGKNPDKLQILKAYCNTNGIIFKINNIEQ